MRFLNIIVAIPVTLAASRYIISLNTNPSAHTIIINNETYPSPEEPLSSINAHSIEILRNLKVEKDIKIGNKFHCHVAPLDESKVKVLKESNGLIKEVFPDLPAEIYSENKKEEDKEENDSDIEFEHVQEKAPHHLVRLSSRIPIVQMPEPLLLNYYYNETGKDVIAYILDTGVQSDSLQFEGRVIKSVNFAMDNTTDDLHGHGTHVAGIVGSKSYGVAKDVDIISVRVLDEFGHGSLVAILEGIQFAVNDRIRRGEKARSVMNMSFGSLYSAVLNDAIDAAYESGLVVVVAAGNDATTASKFSPASAKSAITVGAISDYTDYITSFSNYGSAVDIFAPGFEVQSVDFLDPKQPLIMSGTSMASPIVAGLTANLLEKGVPYDDIRTVLKQKAQLNSEVNFLWGAPGKIMYRKTTTDIVYNGISGPVKIIDKPEKEEKEEEESKNASNETAVAHLVQTYNLSEVDWALIYESAAKNGVDLK